MINMTYSRNGIKYSYVNCKTKKFYLKWRAHLISSGAVIIREWVD